MVKNKKKKEKRIPRAAAVTAAVLALLILVGAVAGWLGLRPYLGSELDLTLLDISARTPSILYAYQPVGRQARSGDLHPAPDSSLSESPPRIYVPYEEMPPALIDAFVAIEDKRFWTHDGVDLLRTARAGLGYLTGRSAFGGSTITQQLIKNLTGDSRHTPDRKLTEIFQALDLEKKTDKTHILEVYLNVINLAEGCYGVGAAAERYFSKAVSELTLPECATIAAITNNPARYNPVTHPEQNRKRRDIILVEMEKQGYISAARRDSALKSPVELHLGATAGHGEPTSWYADMVVSDVIRDLCNRLGYTYEAASMLIYGGGLTIETAMDEYLQAAVERYYADEAHFPVGEDGRPQSSFILIDPETGDILAVAGAVGEKRANRLQNFATDTRRPSGSCIKPLTVYAPALEKGILSWSDLYEDAPLLERNGIPWPANGDGRYRGSVTVGQAVAHSLNPVAVTILEQVGLPEALGFARDQLGMKSLLLPEKGAEQDQTLASLALGQHSRGVTARELTAAYTVFSGGVYRPPLSYHRVLDRNGRVLLENPPDPSPTPVLSPETAALMTKLLTTVTREGTAASRMTLTAAETAGKTGTTQNNCDRWFVGYTPRLLAGVWMGYEYPAPLKGIDGNPCVTIWNQLMETCEALYELHPERREFEVPDTLVEVEFCPRSGRIPTEYCEDPISGCPTEWGWFIRGHEPSSPCDIHSEPPIRWVPHDPTDPNRIPLLPDDLIGIPLPPRGSAPRPAPRYPLWDFFRRHSKKR